MASAPKCKLCGAAHWSSQPHAFERTVEKAKPAAKPLAAITDPRPEPASPVGVPDALQQYLAAQRAGRAAYMRGYRARVKDRKTR